MAAGSLGSTEYGRFIRSLTTQFAGSPKHAKEKADVIAAHNAGAPYPYFVEELKRRALDILNGT